MLVRRLAEDLIDETKATEDRAWLSTLGAMPACSYSPLNRLSACQGLLRGSRHFAVAAVRFSFGKVSYRHWSLIGAGAVVVVAVTEGLDSVKYRSEEEVLCASHSLLRPLNCCLSLVD